MHWVEHLDLHLPCAACQCVRADTTSPLVVYRAAAVRPCCVHTEMQPAAQWLLMAVHQWSGVVRYQTCLWYVGMCYKLSCSLEGHCSLLWHSCKRVLHTLTLSPLVQRLTALKDVVLCPSDFLPSQDCSHLSWEQAKKTIQKVACISVDDVSAWRCIYWMLVLSETILYVCICTYVLVHVCTMCLYVCVHMYVCMTRMFCVVCGWQT